MREYIGVVQEFTIHVDGLFLYKDENGIKAAEAFLKDFLKGQFPFEDVYGSYLAWVDCPDGRQLFFSDNSGMRRFYINVDEVRFEQTFFAALPSDNRQLNSKAIAQFLYFGCVYNNETIENHVVLSNPESYYEVADGRIEEKSKNLVPMNELETDELIMEQMMRIVCKALSDYKNCYCTITGGVDSRSVLAHLLYNHLSPRLDITEQSNHADVMIAKTISKSTGMELLFVPDNPESGWLSEAIAAAMTGMIGVCSYYPLYKKAKILKTYGDVVECGGFAGEMYKNSFINQDFPFYCRKPDWQRFLKYKVMSFDFPMGICGEIIKKEISCMGKSLTEWLRQFDKQNKVEAYLAAGYVILQQRSAGVAALNARYYIAYNPLLERKLAAYGFHRSPYVLEMQAFQRHQVSRYCPAIKGIQTDRGLSCDDGKMLLEWLKSMWFLGKIGLERCIDRKPDECIGAYFAQGLHSPQYERAFKRCKELNVLSKNANLEDVPPIVADRVFLVGNVF